MVVVIRVFLIKSVQIAILQKKTDEVIDMDEQNYAKLQNSLIAISSELFRFQRVFEKAISKLSVDEQSKYVSQFAWFSKKVYRALEDSGFRLLNPEGQLYDPGMAVTTLNIDDFSAEDQLFILQTIEPIIMKDDSVFKTGTVILGRVEK